MSRGDVAEKQALADRQHEPANARVLGELAEFRRVRTG